MSRTKIVHIFALLMLQKIKIRSLVELYEYITEEERLMVDILREIVKSQIPSNFKEKISYNVPYFYGNKGLCIIWPASIPRGGFKEGVLFGMWYGNKLKDVDGYLKHGTNKQIFYKIYKHTEEINESAIIKLLKEAVRLDATFKNAIRKKRYAK